MNKSGRAVGEAARYYKIDLPDIIVFHDELDLAPGQLRVKIGGGNAGHNGLRSITESIGNDYRRVRIGIGHPGDKDRVHDYVLSNFAKAETAWVQAIFEAIAANAGFLAEGAGRKLSEQDFSGDARFRPRAKRRRGSGLKTASPDCLGFTRPI